MAAHGSVQNFLDLKGKTYSTATAGVTTLTAGNNNFDAKELEELIRACKAIGHEVVVTAGAVKIRPKDSAL